MIVCGSELIPWRSGIGHMKLVPLRVFHAKRLFQDSRKGRSASRDDHAAGDECLNGRRAQRLARSYLPTTAQSLLPAARDRESDRERPARRGVVHARRDGEHGLGSCGSHRRLPPRYIPPSDQMWFCRAGAQGSRNCGDRWGRRLARSAPRQCAPGVNFLGAVCRWRPFVEGSNKNERGFPSNLGFRAVVVFYPLCRAVAGRPVVSILLSFSARHLCTD